MRDFKPIKAPKRTPKPAPQVRTWIPRIDPAPHDALRVIRRLLREMRWDNQGGYPGRSDGKWDFISTGIGQVTPDELDKLFVFAGMTPDEIEVVGPCSDCANSDDGRERGYSAPCVSCLRPSHINNFVPLHTVTKKRRTS
jgi:hypothetical protein